MQQGYRKKEESFRAKSAIFVVNGRFDDEKKDLRVQIWGNLFLDICDDFYLQQLCFSEFFDWTIKKSQKVSKTTHFGCF